MGGQLVLVRIWSQKASDPKQSVMPDCKTMKGSPCTSQSYAPTGNTQAFAASGVAYDSICENLGEVRTSKLTDQPATKPYKQNELSKRQWCWKRGKIAVYMGNDNYVVTIEGTSAVVKGVTAFDVRPLCFDEAQTQAAECATSAGTCTNMAGTKGVAAKEKGFTYELNQPFAVMNSTDKTITIKSINSIEQATKTVTTPEGEKFDISDSTSGVLHCFPTNVSLPAGNTGLTWKDCPNAYPKGPTVNNHYGLEVMQIGSTTTKDKFTYSKGTIKTFTDTTYQTASVEVDCGKMADWSLASATVAKPAGGVVPICYDAPQ